MKIILNETYARVQFLEEVNITTIKDLCEKIEVAVEYYKFKLLVIEIDSPGGDVAALNYFNAQLKKWRSLGVVIETVALSRVSSAGAVMLTMGDLGHRKAMPDAKILYHHPRVMGNLTVTSKMALSLNDDLQEVGANILEKIKQHIEPLIVDGFNKNQNYPMADILLKGGKKIKAKALKTLNGYTKHSAETLDALFELDIPIGAQDALALRLIDTIEQ